MTPEERKKEDVNRLIDESLIYQRAYNRLLKLISDMRMEANEQKRIAKENGEPPDEYYKVLIEGLDKLNETFREKTDSLWDMADVLSDKYDEGFFRLSQEILKAAALDYEVALCGHGIDAEKEQRRIEDFAQRRAQYYTTVDFVAVLDRIRAVHPQFVKLCKEKARVIRDETRKARREKKTVENNSVRCPLCGRPLYAWGNLHRREIVIRCTGCALQQTVVVEDGA